MTPTGPYMSPTVQWTTLIIAAAVLVAIFIGLRALWADWRKGWDSDDFAADFLLDRDPHGDCTRAAMVAESGRRWIA